MAARSRTRSRGDSRSDTSPSEVLPCAVGAQLLVQAAKPPVTLVTSRVPAAVFRRGTHRATGLAQVTAVAETTTRREPRHFRESERALIERADRRREIAHAGGVDERRAVRQVEEASGGGRVPAFLLAHQLTHCHLLVRQQTPYQRGLADPGLADEHRARPRSERRQQLLHAGAA